MQPVYCTTCINRSPCMIVERLVTAIYCSDTLNKLLSKTSHFIFHIRVQHYLLSTDHDFSLTWNLDALKFPKCFPAWSLSWCLMSPFLTCVHSHIHLHSVLNLAPIGPLVWQPYLEFVDPPPLTPPPQCPPAWYWGVKCLAFVHSQMHRRRSVHILPAFRLFNCWPTKTTKIYSTCQ